MGPGGAAAGGRLVSGTAVKGPGGNVYAHGTVAGRGIAAGPDGVAAASGVAGGRYGGVSGTRYFSPTYFHAQGLAAARWCNGAGVFTPAWCGAHSWAWQPVGYTTAAWATAAWRAATWPVLGSWLAWNATPAYYDYGDNITYQNDSVYYGSQPVATEQQYYQDAVNLAASSASPAAANTNAETDQQRKWLPLGIFGLMADGQKTPAMVFQLAIDKAGAIRGNYYDQVSDATVPVSGSVDKKNQLVAWRVAQTRTWSSKPACTT